MTIRTASRPARRARGTRRLAALALVATAAAPAGAAAQMVRLEMRPHVGDTIHLRYDQVVEMRATRETADGERAMTMRTALEVHTTAVVLKAERDGALVAASTDSADVSITPDASGREAERLRRQLVGRRVLMHLDPNGKTRVLQAGGMAAEMAALFAQMPALLPSGPVRVGSTWTQTVTVPLTGQQASAAAGTLLARFRLDSLSGNGDVAYISLTGSLARSPITMGVAPAGVAVETSGTVNGALAVDRRLGWLAGARFDVVTTSTYTPVAGSSARPMTVRTKATQALRRMEDRP